MDILWQFVENRSIGHREKYGIAKLKDQHWNYGIESQINWMDNNLNDSDVHLLGIDNSNSIVAYLTISNVQIEFNSKKYSMLGIGNVCVDKSIEKLGYGRRLIHKANEYITEIGQNGILLCKDSLVEFYKKCDWVECLYQEAFICNNVYSKNILLYPSLGENITIIRINRNF